MLSGLNDEKLRAHTLIIGASVSEPHTSESNWDFSYMYYFLTYVLYILNTNAIAAGHMWTVRFFVQFGFFDSQLA